MYVADCLSHYECIVSQSAHTNDALHTFYFIYSRICSAFCVLKCARIPHVCAVYTPIALLLATYETISTKACECVWWVTAVDVAWRSHEQFSIVLQTEKCQIIMYGTAGWMWVAYVRCTKNTIMPGVSPHSVRGIFIIWNAAVRWLLWYGNMSLRFGGWWLRRQNDMPGRGKFELWAGGDIMGIAYMYGTALSHFLHRFKDYILSILGCGRRRSVILEIQKRNYIFLKYIF